MVFFYVVDVIATHTMNGALCCGLPCSHVARTISSRKLTLVAVFSSASLTICAADFSVETIHGAFPFVVILVQRLCSDFFRVTVRCKPRVASFGPVGCGTADFFASLDSELPGYLQSDSDGSDGSDMSFGVAVVPSECVGDIVRAVAINADLACQAMHNGQVCVL